MQTIRIAVQHLTPDPAQPRTAIPEVELAKLAASIQTRGLLLPLRVRPAGQDGFHVIVSGHRRYAALLRLGAMDATCIIVDGRLDEASVLAEQLTENLLREDLSPIEEAEGYRRYIALRRITAVQAAEELQVPPARISRALPLLNFPREVREAIHGRRIAKETAYYLSRLPEGDERDGLVAQALAGTLTRDAAARSVKTAKRQDSDDSPPVNRMTCKLAGGRSLTISAPAIKIDGLIELLEDVLKEARKARMQGWDVGTLARVFRDRAAKGGVS